MIRTVSGELVSKFLSESFVDFMSHFCDTDLMDPCAEAKCEITEAEWNAIPESFVEETLGEALPAFEDVGGMTFVRKKIAQLIKIAKSGPEIQLDLVSELILYLIGMNCINLSWEDEDGVTHYPAETFDFPERQQLLESMWLDPEEFEDDDDIDTHEINEDITDAFDSFWSLMRINYSEDGYVFYDDDYSFLLEDDVAEGIHKLYKTMGDYSKEWYLKPWTDIGEEVPPVVTYELDAVEVEGINFGGVQEMRYEYAKATLGKIFGDKD